MPLGQVLIQSDEKNTMTYHVYGLGLQEAGGDYNSHHFDHLCSNSHNVGVGSSLIDKKKIKKVLLNKIAGFLANYGFNNRIYGQSFWKPLNIGRGMIHLHFINHTNDFDVTVSVSIRFDKLEEMINKNNILLKVNEKNLTSTIGVELGNLTKGVQRRWTVKGVDDIEFVACDICKMIVKAALPYIEKYKDMDTVFEMIMRDDPDVWMLSPLRHRLAMNAVGLAKLLNKNELLDEIIRAKTKYLEEKNDYGLQLFIQFANKISKH